MGNTLCAFTALGVYYATYATIRPMYPPFGNYFVNAMLGICYFRTHLFIFNRVPTKESMFRKMLITVFFTILFVGRCMEVFTISNYQSSCEYIILSLAIGAAARYALGYVNESSLMNTVRDTLFVL